MYGVQGNSAGRVYVFSTLIQLRFDISSQFYDCACRLQIFYAREFHNTLCLNCTFVYLCGVRRLATDPVVMRSSPVIDIYVMHCWLIIPNKFNLLLWLLAYLCNK